MRRDRSTLSWMSTWTWITLAACNTPPSITPETPPPAEMPCESRALEPLARILTFSRLTTDDHLHTLVLRDGETIRTVDLTLPGEIDLTSGLTLPLDDVPTRLTWSHRHNHPLAVVSDALGWLPSDGYGEFEGLTAAEVFTLDASATRLAWLTPDTERGRCLWHAALDASGTLDAPERILCDSGLIERNLQLRSTSPAFEPGGAAILVAAMHDATPNRTDLLRIALDPPHEARLATEPVPMRNTLRILGWDASGPLLVSDETGADNLHRAEITAPGAWRLQPLTRSTVDLQLAIVEGGVLAVRADTLDSTIELLDPTDGQPRATLTLAGGARLLGAHDQHALLELRSASTPLRLVEILLHDDEITIAERGGLPDTLVEHALQCDAQRIALGHETAILYTPRAAAPRFGLVAAAYGGSDRFDAAAQLWCEQGAAVLSPVIGGDLGGPAELGALDAAGQALAERLSLEQVGLTGASRGGYTVLRALTRPPAERGFAWAFGVAHAPFTDLEAYARKSPDWLAGELDVTNRELLRERSPIHHVEHLDVPMLITHGSADPVVAPEHTARFLEAARAADRDSHIELVALDGQAHGPRTREELTMLWQARWRFVDAALRAARR